MIAFYFFSGLVPKYMTMSLEELSCSDIRHTFDDVVHTNLQIFCLSKVIELPDTFFIVTRNRYPIFLHWFHHIATMWFCWYTVSQLSPDGYIFATMNSFVHSIMYPYYAFVLFISSLKTFGPLITIVQTSQMVIGTSIAVYQFIQYHFMNRTFKSVQTLGTFDVMNDKDKDTCHADPVETNYAVVMYSVYLILFFKIMVKLIKTRWFSSKIKEM
jgi:hypothetical protein